MRGDESLRIFALALCDRILEDDFEFLVTVAAYRQSAIRYVDGFDLQRFRAISVSGLVIRMLPRLLPRHVRITCGPVRSLLAYLP